MCRTNTNWFSVHNYSAHFSLSAAKCPQKLPDDCWMMTVDLMTKYSPLGVESNLGTNTTVMWQPQKFAKRILADWAWAVLQRKWVQPPAVHWCVSTWVRLLETHSQKTCSCSCSKRWFHKELARGELNASAHHMFQVFLFVCFFNHASVCRRTAEWTCNLDSSLQCSHWGLQRSLTSVSPGGKSCGTGGWPTGGLEGAVAPRRISEITSVCVWMMGKWRERLVLLSFHQNKTGSFLILQCHPDAAVREKLVWSPRPWPGDRSHGGQHQDDRTDVWWETKKRS